MNQHINVRQFVITYFYVRALGPTVTRIDRVQKVHSMIWPLPGTLAFPIAEGTGTVRDWRLSHMLLYCLLCRANNVEVKLAAVKACLDLLSGPLPAICMPPSAAAPEVKALASKEEMGRVALAR